MKPATVDPGAEQPLCSLASASGAAQRAGMLHTGFELVTSVFPEEQIAALRAESDRLVADTDTACLRHLGRRSPLFRGIALGERLSSILAMSPLLLHASRKSTIPARRRVIHFEYAPPDALHPDLRWAEQG